MINNVNKQKQLERKKLQDDIDKFLKKGGEIKKIEAGVSSLDGHVNRDRVTRQHRKKKNADPVST